MTTYLNLVISLLVVVGQLLTKVTVPLLRQIGEKLIYASKQYIEEHQKKNPQLTIQTPQTSASLSTDQKQKSNETIKSTDVEEPKKAVQSTNPYDDPPEPEIMD